MLVEIRLIVVFMALFLLPGCALLAIGNQWRRWTGLQRWIVAIALSIVFYPILFYLLRRWLPALTLGPFKIGLLLLICAVIVVWKLRREWREWFRFDALEWIALAIFGVTMCSRLWIAHHYPYPAWSDSLHHTLITWLTSQNGALPTSLEPHFPIPLQIYHLGLYAIASSVEWLAQVRPHTALLWTAQVLNGLVGIGVYLVLDRKVGRLGAIGGAAVVGLFSHHPGFYVNWGRFTQLAGQTVLLITWLVTVETIALRDQWRSARFGWGLLFSALMMGGMFFLHFRVFLFFALLLLPSLLLLFVRQRTRAEFFQVFAKSILIGLATLLLIAPVFWEAGTYYVEIQRTATQNLNPAEQVQAIEEAFSFDWQSIPHLVAGWWLIRLAAVAALIGLIRRNSLTLLLLIWVALLMLPGYAYLAGFRLLNVTNLGAILILGYLPIGLLIGIAIAELHKLLPERERPRIAYAVAVGVLLVGLPAGWVRAQQVEHYRHFVLPQDVEAMTWIRDNLPEDARFAINTHFWLPNAPHGTDAGYWIPYFTRRGTTASAMLFMIAPPDYRSDVLYASRLAKQLEIDFTTLDSLHEIGVEYIYVGARGNFVGPGLNVEKLAESERVELLYENLGAGVLRILE